MSKQSPIQQLESYRWRNRLILLFFPETKHPAYLEQLEQLEGYENDLEARDVSVLHFQQTRKEARLTLPESDAQQLRQHFDIDPDTFTFVLVGKDGTVKRRAEHPVSLTDLLAQIDAMPMRQAEMRQAEHD